MIFKMHPLLEKEQGFLWAKQRYADCKWLLFWDNTNDFYEILDKIDLCIMDYSSIFTDFIAAGCKHFLRYAFDFDNDDYVFIPGIKDAVKNKTEVIKAYVVNKDFAEIELRLGELTDDERQIITDGCLINYYKYN